MHPLVSRVPTRARLAFRQALFLLAATLLVSQLTVSLFAQANMGRIQGSITDQTGSAIAGATVTVTDTARGISRTLTTEDAGTYLATNLTPGAYVVRAEAKGFKTTERSNILLQVGSEWRRPSGLRLTG